jgi:hypothetical protein
MCDKTNCCQVAAKADALKASAQSFGLDASWVADILTKYGPETLALVVEACRQGLTASLVTEVVTTFGPGLLLKNMKKLDSSVVPGVLVPGESTGIIDVVIQQYLPVIIEKYLPVLLQQYGPQILQAILKIIQQSVTPAPAPNPTPVS